MFNYISVAGVPHPLLRENIYIQLLYRIFLLPFSTDAAET